MKLLNKISNISSTKFLIVYLTIPFLYTLVLGLQGFDMCDEGWCLTGYQQLFEHPTSAEYQFLYYNSLLVGAIWNFFFADLGIFGFRLLSSICTTLILLIVYKLLCDISNRWHIMIGMLLILFSMHFTMVFHHNLLTALICCLSIYFIFKALTSSCYWKMILGGFFIGINIFTRIPNVSMTSLSLVLIPYYLYDKNPKSLIYMFVCGVFGVLLGIGLEILFMISINQWSVFLEGIASGFSAASAGDSTHNLSQIVKIYISNYSEILQALARIMIMPSISYIIAKSTSNKTLLNVMHIIIPFIMFWIVFWYANGIAAIYSFCYLIMLIYLLANPKESHTTYIITLSTIVMLFLPFGSDYGIGNMGSSCIWISIPLCVSLFFALLDRTKSNRQISRILLVSFIIFAFAFSLKNIRTMTKGGYFDSGKRHKMTNKVNHPLTNVFTTKERCNITNELISELNKYTKEKDYLLCWQSLPMAHYLTHTYPYLNNSWPWTYDATNLERHFSRAKREINTLPVVLCNKSSIADWDIYNKEWNSNNATDQWNFNNRKIAAFRKFIQENNYITVWENELFIIMVPSDRTK